MSTEPDDITRSEAGTAPGLDGAGCSVCLEFDWAEEDAERVGDLSLATDWRILRRRHQAADHPAGAPDHPAQASRADSADAPTASTH